MNRVIVEEFLGLSLKEAQELCIKNNLIYRVTQKDGNVGVVTRDHVRNRINFKIENNIIIDAKIG